VLPSTEHFGAALSARDLALARAGGRCGRSRRRAARSARPVSACDGDHQTQNASYFEHAAGAIVVPARSSIVPERRARAARDDETLAAMREAMLGARTARGRRDRGGADRLASARR
jgi:UDP-N-acetylglucosamine:LPS N-acetylglucosamine transferase